MAFSAPDSRSPRTAPRENEGDRLEPFRDELLAWLREEPTVSVRRIRASLADRIGAIGERTVKRFVDELRATLQSEHQTSGSRTERNGSAAEGTLACTPADPTPLPKRTAEGLWDYTHPEHYLNRERTWLNFNFRVLREAEDERLPMLERVRFLAIVSSNLDEFFMKRIGGLKQQAGARLRELTVDGRTPEQQIAECKELVRVLEKRKRNAFLGVLEELSREGICLRFYTELDEAQKALLREYFRANIYPLLTPQVTDPAHPFPFISNLSLNLLVSLRHPDEPRIVFARLKIPYGNGVPRFVRVGSEDTFVRLEGIVANNLDIVFPGMEIESFAAFRVTRNSNTEREEEKADDLLAMIEGELQDRRFAPIVRLEVAKEMKPHHRSMLAAELGLQDPTDVFEVEGILALRDLHEFANLDRGDLHYVPHYPLDHPGLTPDRNIFHVIRDAGSILLHHPYISFATSVERFLREASRDPKVRAIKMALYRTSADSNVIRHLIEAAQNGKQVAVLVELKARFDEQANIRFANHLEEAGIHVTYGVVGLKTHCKIILVVRQDYNGLRRYAHIGTGNYHAGNARLYTDFGLLTSDHAIGEDLTELTNYLTSGFKPRRDYKKILPSPKMAKQALLSKIEREISKSTAEKPGLIQFKMNALEDADIVRALYQASQAGVKIDLLVRDTCRLRAGIPGLSDNIRVISIVGRFLEHGRLFYFQNGGDEEYYIGSADCMKRNLLWRVEVLAPVEDPELRAQLRHVLDTQIGDERSAWEMQPDGSYRQRRSAKGRRARGTHEALIDWYEKRQKTATRMRRRKTRGFPRMPQG
ncbi:MAG: polyphosphate kinase 1 [Planctomycetes bacterium]|nr:polyphosphate kinase 1 [Planctomycetota bacterium]